MGQNVLKQQRRLELVDECLRSFEKPKNIDEIAKYCNPRLGYGPGEKGISTRQYKYDIEKIDKTYGAYGGKIRVETNGGKKCYTYCDMGFTITNNDVLGHMERARLKKIMDYLSNFFGLGLDAGLSEATDEIGQILGYDKDDNAVVSFEKTDLVCHGEEKVEAKFNMLFKAIIQKQTLNVKYVVPRSGTRNWIVYPQFLKQYNQRWYLIATKHREDANKVNHLALDRIETIEPNNNIPYLKCGIDFADYFNDVVGVTKPEGSEPQEIILQVEKKEYPYIKSKPIHPSQDELFDSPDGEDYVRISLYVYDNYELRRDILSYGSKVKVISPQSLRDKIADELKKSLNNYK